jgi:hypothetical protein
MSDGFLFAPPPHDESDQQIEKAEPQAPMGDGDILRVAKEPLREQRHNGDQRKACKAEGEIDRSHFYSPAAKCFA